MISKLPSKFLTLLGSLAIGSPASLKMPGDFYNLVQDRALPLPGEDDWTKQRSRVAVNNFRRGLTVKVMKWIFLVNVVTLIVFLAFFFGSDRKPVMPGAFGLMGGAGALMAPGMGADPFAQVAKDQKEAQIRSLMGSGMSRREAERLVGGN